MSPGRTYMSLSWSLNACCLPYHQHSPPSCHPALEPATCKMKPRQREPDEINASFNLCQLFFPSNEKITKRVNNTEMVWLCKVNVLKFSAVAKNVCLYKNHMLLSYASIKQTITWCVIFPIKIVLSFFNHYFLALRPRGGTAHSTKLIFGVAVRAASPPSFQGFLWCWRRRSVALRPPWPAEADAPHYSRAM